ncbi:MAG: 5-formyltetrahydrofolate cyclo-ligase [Alphaproteobacteria bacterium]|nr:5-formyltetrahydrofolate cyclo-ligase [Alphaproteobacteria bacterium]
MNKQTLRNAILAERKSLDSNFIQHNSQKIFQQYQKFNFSKNSIIACYSPIHGEVDTKLIIEDACIILLPKVIQGSRILEFYEIFSNKIYLPEIILAPLVAFDKHGSRLGYGGGYYDATLNYYKTINHNPLYIGLAYDFQEVTKIDTDNYDVPLQGVITNSKKLMF